MAVFDEMHGLPAGGCCRGGEGGLPARRAVAGRGRRWTRWTRAGARRSCSSGASGSPSPSMAEAGDTERLIPFDIIPRITRAAMNGPTLETGPASSACEALNAFLHDIYHDAEHPQGRRGPRRPHPPVTRTTGRRCSGIDAARRHLCPHRRASMWCARTDGFYRVLEDNLRTPSGVSLHAREPRDDDAAVPGAVRAAVQVEPVEPLPGRAAREPALGVAPDGIARSRRSWC